MLGYDPPEKPDAPLTHDQKVEGLLTDIKNRLGCLILLLFLPVLLGLFALLFRS